jgi:hypothetical protein
VKSSKVVQQRTDKDKVKIARMAKVKEIMEAAAAAAAQWKRLKEEEEQQEQQEEQAPKKRGKQKTFDDRMEDLKRYKETHGHINVFISKEKTLYQFCANARHARKNPGKSKIKQLTDERILAFDAIGLNWMLGEYITRSFDERIEDLEEYKQTHGHLNVKRHKDDNLYQFIAGIRHSLKKLEKDRTRKLTVERIVRLNALGFEW